MVIRNPPVLACAGRQLDVILTVSGELSVNCIHIDQRRRFQEELQQIKGTEGTLLKSKRSQKMFKNLCIEVYNTWRKNLKGELLHPLDEETFRNSLLSTTLLRRRGSLDIKLREDTSLDSSSLALLLTDMLNSQRFFQSSVDGKRIAMTRSGSFEHTSPKNYHVVKLAITELSDVQSAFVTVCDKFDRVDLINNTEYSRHFEELSDRQIGTQKEVNFFGLINVTMAVETIRN